MTHNRFMAATILIIYFVDSYFGSINSSITALTKLFKISLSAQKIPVTFFVKKVQIMWTSN